MKASMIHDPGHLRNGGIPFLRHRHPFVCDMCGSASEGAPNQLTCNECKKTQAYTDRVKAARRASSIRQTQRKKAARQA